jgi:hypothetical protein
MAAQWRAQLRRLIAGEQPAVALVTGATAWIVYRVGKRCYIQQRYFVTAASREIGPRETHSEDGQRISEWSTTTEDIAHFITPRPNHALQRTRPSRHCCNPRVPCAGSLSLGR